MKINKTKKNIIFSVSILVLLGCFYFYGPSLAQTEVDTSPLQELIQRLKQQIENLRAQIEILMAKVEELRQAWQEVRKAKKEVRATLRLIRRLRRGMSGEDVKMLQEILATDPEIYPEGLITGYFGPLTEKAVKRFQKIAGIEQVGIVGPKTLAKINELLEYGAGKSGKVPPGLLIAPGIRKKLGFLPQPLPGQILPPGIAKKLGEATTTPPEEGEEGEEEATTTPDIVAPIISEIGATSTTPTSTIISWLTDEPADSKVWYTTSTPLIVTTSTPMVSFSDLVTNHSLTISDLIASTTYYYLVSSTDTAGNTATSSEFLFTTLAQQD